MGLNIYLLNSNGEEVDVDLAITHNLTAMASEIGYYETIWRPDETDLCVDGKVLCADIVSELEKALIELLHKPEYYKTFNPSNGFGSYDGFVKFLTRYIIACNMYPTCYLEISR